TSSNESPREISAMAESIEPPFPAQARIHPAQNFQSQRAASVDFHAIPPISISCVRSDSEDVHHLTNPLTKPTNQPWPITASNLSSTSFRNTKLLIHLKQRKHRFSG
ncbi:MAG: hypothetical protein V4640_16235, partial [Verrucomicrobiota bacterium]